MDCPTIMVAGTGRSGTTWLGSVIASQLPCRIMFEPFHSRLVDGFRRFQYFQYMRPTEPNEELSAFCQKVFSGQIRDKWIDRQVDRLFPEFRLIKEIRANLFLKWIHNHFPQVRLLFIIRHPCAVVSSRMNLNWATDSDIQPFLAQPELVHDLLSDQLDLMRRVETVEEKHAIIWCVNNLVPLKHFTMNELKPIFYERLVLDPEGQAKKVFHTLDIDYSDSVSKYMNRPSTTSVRESAIVTGDNKLTRWTKVLSPRQVQNILSIVKAFELDYLYGDSTSPLVNST
jgi:hypothetical protein